MLSHKGRTLECIKECKLIDSNKSVNFIIPETNMTFGNIYKNDEIKDIKFLYHMKKDGFGDNLFFKQNDKNYRLSPFGKIIEVKEQ
jgi:hypothetical protein